MHVDGTVVKGTFCHFLEEFLRVNIAILDLHFRKKFSLLLWRKWHEVFGRGSSIRFVVSSAANAGLPGPAPS